MLNLGACGQAASDQNEPDLEHESLLVGTEEEVNEEDEKEVTITLGAIGDILLHERVYELAETENGYDFLPMLSGVEPLLKAPDFLMANQESMPGGVEIGLSTYPSFNSPQEIVSNLQSLGVQMVIGANNHTLDRGVKAIERALTFYDDIGMDYVGVYRDAEDRDRDRMVEIEDVKIGVLAYTYGTNGIPIPDGHQDVVALIDPERIEEDVKRLRSQVDVMVVHMHWGAEYEREPNEQQRKLAQQLSKAGVDIIFGHHPHVLQPIDVIHQDSGHETTVFYSLGNFLSGQTYDYTDIGGVATIQVTKTANGELHIHSPNIEPTLVIREENGYVVYPFEEADRTAISGSTFAEVREHTLRYLTP